MSDRKNELSKKSKYWLPKHRYLELRHYCLQYPMWRKAYAKLEYRMGDDICVPVGNGFGDPVGELASTKAELLRNMELIEKTARNADKDLWWYLLKSATEDMSYTKLSTQLDIPCQRGMFYDRYRRFYWLLSKEKGM